MFIAFRDRGFKKQSDTEKLIGCAWDILFSHIQSKFVSGMSIDNYGKWHIDHIIPLSSAKSEEELRALCHYTNLQPLWAAENLSKGSRMPSLIGPH